MRTLISLTFSLSLLSGIFSDTANWIAGYLNWESEQHTTTNSTVVVMPVMDTVAISDASLIEGNDTMTTDMLKFVVERKETTSDFRVWFNTRDSTAKGSFLTDRNSDTDFIPTGSYIHFTNGGDLTDTVSVSILADRKTELDEYLKVTLGQITHTSDDIHVSDSLAIGTIINNDTSYFSIRDTMIIEGDAATDSLCFVVDMEGELDTSFSYNFLLFDSTATVAGGDYPSQSGMRTGSGTGVGTGTGSGVGYTFYGIDTIKVAIFDDTVTEFNEFLKLVSNTINGNGRSLIYKDSLAIGTIVNDDTARISINDVIMKEGDVGTTLYTFMVTLDNDLGTAITVDYATWDSTATIADGDYLLNKGTLNFTGTANEQVPINVYVKGDRIAELDEIFKVKLSNIYPSDLAVVFEDSLGLGYILNDDFEPTIVDPCDCLENASSTSAKDGQFSETVTVMSQSGEAWYITAINGLYQPPSSTFPPAKGGNPYPLNNFATGFSGYQLEEIPREDGLSDYIINGIHVDGIKYEVTVSNGAHSLSIGNLCHYETACDVADQLIVMPSYPNLASKITLDDCNANNKFIDDGIHIYSDDEPRNNQATICPNIAGQSLSVSFQAFDLAVGDTLAVYEGKNTGGNLIARGSGTSPSQFNGGWVASNCDPGVNPSGCLTFVFTTNGDNRKGSGWEALASCSLQGTTTLNRPDDVFATVSCDSLTTPVNLRAPTINGTGTDCALANDDIIVTYCDVRDTLNAGQLSNPVFPFGTYEVEYKLLADTTITTSNRVHVSVPPLTCNDTITTAIGQGCVTMLTPDDILENGCDTIGGPINQQYKIRVKTDKGYIDGTAPNFPILDASKGGNVTCNQFYEVSIYRIMEANVNGCLKTAIDSCKSVVRLIDGIKPVFVEVEPDTIFGCHDITLTADMLPKPTVIDNCEIDRLEVSVPPSTNGPCKVGKSVEVTWTAYDLCGNASSAKQTFVILRPNRLEIPNDTIVDCSTDLAPSSIGWPKIDADGDGKGDFVISPEEGYCNFELTYKDETIPGTCGSNFNIMRIFTLFDDCQSTSELIFKDTQFIVLKDTIAPEIICPVDGVLGSISNPYRFPTAFNSCKGRPGEINLPTGTDACNAEVNTVVTGVYSLTDNRLIANNLSFLNPLETGAYRVSYALRDECGNGSEACNIYFNIMDQTIPTAICSDELVVSLANGDLVIGAAELSSGSYDVCGLDTILVRRTICGSPTEYPETINSFVADKFGTELDANGWSSSITVGCCDMNTTIKVQLLIFDRSGNYNKCWLTISPENQPQSVCGDLPDAEDFCDNYSTNYLGQSTDVNNDRNFDEEEWQPIEDELVGVINSQFGSPACNASNTLCTNSSIEQHYQLIRDFCGVQTMRRRFRTINTEGGPVYPWYHQNIKINYRPNWSFTFPADTTLQCATVDAQNLPEMPLEINEGTCDQIAWEVRDEVFETEDGACFKILRRWEVVNACQHDASSQPTILPRDQIAGKVTANSKRTFSSGEVINGVPLNTQGRFAYTQVILVLDNEAPIITIADVDTCIVGVGDIAPFSEPDITPGTFPYECDTLRLFSATGMDCSMNSDLDFRYEIFDEDVRVSFGNGDFIYHVVQPNRTYRVRFTASDNCGNIGAAERTFIFRDCRLPSPVCQGISLNLNNTQSASFTIDDINDKSFDNCTDSANLDLRLWHPALGTTAPTSLTEVLALPTVINLDCNSLGSTTAILYAIDEAQNYDFCQATINLTDNLRVCPAAPRVQIAGRIQTEAGDMVEAVEVQVSGTGPMPEMITTDFSGTFKYEVVSGADYMIRPQKDKNPLNGVSTFDLVLIQKHILGLKPFDSPYKYIAADINQSATVTAYDMVILRQLILNILTDFPNNESWKFVNMQYPMSSPNPLLDGYQEYHRIAKISNNVAIDFTAIKVGDVNGNAKPHGFLAAEDRTFDGIFDLHLKDQFVQTGHAYTLDFTTNGLSTIEGYQFTLQYEGLTFDGWKGGIVEKDYFGYHLAKKGFITTSWNIPTSDELLQNGPVFQLQFTATESGLLSEMVQISSAITEAESYDSNGELLEVQLVFDEVTPETRSFTLEQNRPNPFKQSTQIDFYLPEASEVNLTVTGITGKVLKMVKGNYDKGDNTIVLDRQDIPATGLLYYQLESSAGKLTKTMLLFD